MIRTLRLTAALLATLALPALAQTAAPNAPTTPGRPVVGTPTSPASPAARPATPAPRSNAAPAAPAPAAATPTASAAGSKIDVNGATEQQLDALPGVGPARAQAIVASRPWTELNELVTKKALPQNVFNANKERLALANINTSSAADLAKTLPGIGEVRSRAIVAGRPYATPQELVTKKVITESLFNKIKELIAY